MVLPRRQQLGRRSDRHDPPSTLTHTSATLPPSPHLSPTVSVLAIAILTTLCCHHVSGFSLGPYAKAKSCVESKDCQDFTKECVDEKCHCRPYFDYIPGDDICVKAYGATCTFWRPEGGKGEVLCNTEKFLSCDDTGTCSCHQEGDSISFYDPNLETCVAPPGHQCELIGFMSVKKGCVLNAECVDDPTRIIDKLYYGVCECSPGWVAKEDRCIPAIGSSCLVDADCEQDGIECFEGQCRCSKDRIYYKDTHECKLQVGKDCFMNVNDCVYDADCVGDRNVFSKWEWKCACNLGYQEITNNGTCERDRPGNCKNAMVYDEYREKCSLQVGRDCLPMEVNRCVKHAFCGTRNRCQCFEAYQVTENGTCEKMDPKERSDNPIKEDLSTLSRESSTIRILSAHTRPNKNEYTDCANCITQYSLPDPDKRQSISSSTATSRGRQLFKSNSITIVLTLGVIIIATSYM